MRYHRNSKKEKHHPNIVFTEEEESILLTVCQAYSNIDLGWGVKKVQENVKVMFSKSVCTSTCRRFLERHDDVLKVSVVRSLGQDRVKLGLYEEAMNWIDKMSAFLAKKKPPAEAVVNLRVESSVGQIDG